MYQVLHSTECDIDCLFKIQSLIDNTQVSESQASQPTLLPLPAQQLTFGHITKGGEGLTAYMMHALEMGVRKIVFHLSFCPNCHAEYVIPYCSQNMEFLILKTFGPNGFWSQRGILITLGLSKPQV